MKKRIDLWLDLRSLYSFPAKDPAYALEREFGIELSLRPCGLNIGGVVNLNDPATVARGLHKIKYLHADRKAAAARCSISPIRASSSANSTTKIPAPSRRCEGAEELAQHQQEADRQGVFAVPTFVVDGELFWGQDRLEFVRAKLAA